MLSSASTRTEILIRSQLAAVGDYWPAQLTYLHKERARLMDQPPFRSLLDRTARDSVHIRSFVDIAKELLGLAVLTDAHESQGVRKPFDGGYLMVRGNQHDIMYVLYLCVGISGKGLRSDHILQCTPSRG